MQKYANEKGYVNLKLGNRKTQDQFKNKMTVEIDLWKPEQKDSVTPEQAQAIVDKPVTVEDLPF